MEKFSLSSVIAAKRFNEEFEEKLVDAVKNWLPDHEVELLNILSMNNNYIEVLVKKWLTSFPTQVSFKQGLITWDEINK